MNIDLVIDGLGDFAPDSLGDFDIDIAYDATALTLTGFGLGDFLGDTGLGEAGDFSLGDLGGGLVNLAEVSFLLPAELDLIQPASFSLATLDFQIASLALGASTTISVDTIYALGDGFGRPLTLEGTSDAVISRPAGGTVPEPGSLFLILAGIGTFRMLRHRQTKKSYLQGG